MPVTPGTSGWKGEHLGDQVALVVFRADAAGSPSYATTTAQHAGRCDPAVPPVPVLGAAATASRSVIVPPHGLGVFLRRHSDAVLLCHDAAHWHWTLHRHLTESDDEPAMRALWAFSAQARLIDVRLLQKQIWSWQRKDAMGEMTLVKVAKEVAKCKVPAAHDLQRAARQCIDEPGNSVPAAILGSAAKAVLDVYGHLQKSAVRIEASLDKNLLRRADVKDGEPPENSVDPKMQRWFRQLSEAKQPPKPPAEPSLQRSLTGDQRRPAFGLLGVGIDVQADIALNRPHRAPLVVDQENLALVLGELDKRFADASKKLYDSQARKCFAWEDDPENRKVACDESGKPQVRLGQLKKWLQQTAGRLTDINNCAADVPLNDSQQTWSDPESWGVWAECDPLLFAWLDLHRAARLRQAVHPSELRPTFTVWPTIRSFGPDLSALKSLPTSLFRPRHGHVFLVGRLLDLPARALAAVCKDNWHRTNGRLANYFLPRCDDPMQEIARELEKKIAESRTESNASNTAGDSGKTLGAVIADGGADRNSSYRAAAEQLIDVLPLGLSDPLVGTLLKQRYGIGPIAGVEIERLSRALRFDVVTELAGFSRDDVAERLAAVLGVQRTQIDKLINKPHTVWTADEYLVNQLQDSRKRGNVWDSIRDVRAAQGQSSIPPDEGIVKRVLINRVTTLAGRAVPPTFAAGARRLQWLGAQDEAMKAAAYALVAEEFNLVAVVGNALVLEVPLQQAADDDTHLRISTAAAKAQRSILSRFAATCWCDSLNQW